MSTNRRGAASQIFNYYDCRISNAYTESINRIGKDINRMGRGYSFEVIRVRLLYEDKGPRRQASGRPSSKGRRSGPDAIRRPWDK